MENGVYYGDGYSGDGYMEQEEEWEREGLLDPAWEKQQKKNTPNVTSVMFFVTNTNQKHHHRDDDEIGTKLGGC
uniref:Uncharacterized protein n=1 Tax=Phlebotomus papatasi TaxID=29031 RepID=A0A1B0D003_PHLPP